MAEITRASRLAVVEESTVGTPKAPSTGADYISAQEGFSFKVGFETLENAELAGGSIGRKKSIQGLESATGSLNHYIRHSGVEGQAQQLGLSALLKATYGTKTVAATEYDTIAGSTTKVVKVDAGEGANYQIGQALLVKHAAYAWEIAVIKSISTDDLTLLFALQNAPAAGTLLGKAVSYVVAPQGYQGGLTLWDYRGNGAAIAAVAGSKVTSFKLDAAAGGLINGSFELAGVKGFFDPIEIIAGTNDKIDFNDGGVKVATLSAKLYKDPLELAAEIQQKMDAQSTDTITCTYSSSTGKFTIATSGAALTLLFLTGANNADSVDTTIGFTHTDHSAALTYTSEVAVSWASPQTPAVDSQGPLVAKNNRVMVGTQDDNLCFSVQSIAYELNSPKVDEKSICAESGVTTSIPNDREVKVGLVANLKRNQADLFKAFRASDSISFQFSMGEKEAGNWLVGKCAALSIKDCVVTTHELGDSDGLVTLQIDLTGHVDGSANPETALSFV